MEEINVAVLPGDGIGKEIMEACLKLLSKVNDRVGGYSLNYHHIDAGAEFYLRTNEDITESDFRTCGEADAILFGAMGLPDVFFEDGTEIAPHLKLRDEYGSGISTRLMEMFLNEFVSLQSAIDEINGFNELKNRLKDMRESKWLFPDE